MGGDFAAKQTVKGAILAKKILSPEDKLFLFGVKEIIVQEFQNLKEDIKDFEIIDCHDVLEMGCHPVKAFKEKSNSSLVKGFYYLKENAIDGFASAGSTGAMLVGSTQITGVIDGIERPCISSYYPNISGENSLILDVGLNADCKPENLVQFAQLGYLFAKFVMEKENPKVGLLNIGSEDTKGNALAKAVFLLIKEDKTLNFIGNVEGYDLSNNDMVDVIVTDAFTGNIVLKHAESFYNIAKYRNISDDFFDAFNYENYGGTPILGINQPVIIGHGKSNDIAIKNMILLTKNMIIANLADKIKSLF
jgi:glycerol-3-phosphate acyltransferase PlsX